MIIKSINIASFGGLKNKVINFSDGTNVVFGENEAGKSTICAFIQAMLYGMNKPLVSDKRTDIRKKYLPWDTQTASGSIEFSHDEKNYVLERKFGKTKRADKAVLRYLDNWEECQELDSDNIGMHLLGLNEESYVKTIYMGQLATGISGKDDEIITKLSNLSATGDEEASFVKIKDILSSAKYAVKPKSTAKSILGDLAEKKKHLTEEKEHVLSANESVKDYIVELNLLTKKIFELRADADKLSEEKIKAREYEKFLADTKINENIIKLNERKKENEDKLKEAEKAVCVIQKKVENFDEKLYAESALRLSELEEKKKSAQVYKLTHKDKCDAVDKIKNELDAVKKQCSKIPALIMLCLFLLLAVSALAAGLAFGKNIFLAVALTSVVPLAFLILFIHKVKNSRQSAKKMEVELENAIKIAAEISALSDTEKTDAEIDKILSALNVKNAEEIKKAIEENNILKNKAEQLYKEAEMLKDSIAQNKNDIKINGEMLSGTKECEPARPYDEIENEQELNNDRILSAETRKKELDFKITHACEGLRTPDIIESELSEILSCEEYYTSVHKSLEIALSVMEECEKELKSGFTPELYKTVNAMLSNLSDKRYCDLKLGDNYSAMIKEPLHSTIVNAENLSGGTCDIIYIAVRLGILQTIFGEKIPLVIMDDSFLQLDDERQLAAISFLKEKNMISQFFYFTCHRDVLQKFGQSGEVNIIEI